MDEAPDDADALTVLASALAMRADDTGAVAAAREAVRLEPGSARAHTTLAVLLQNAEPAVALEHARRAVELDPASPHAQYNLGLVEHVGGRVREARAAFEAAGRGLGIDVTPWWRRRRRPAEPTA